MATRSWRGAAIAVAQVSTATPTAANSTLYTLTINGKDVSYTSDGSATVAEITAGLTAAWNASAQTEIAEVTATDSTTHVTLTGDTAGKPFTVTSTGAGTINLATTTAATGPNHWNDADNWSGTTVPTTGDTAIVDLSLGSVLYGLDASGDTLASLIVLSPSFTSNTLGLPRVNAGGYTEYRDRYLKIGATLCTIDTRAQRVNINFGSVQTTCEIRTTGTGAETNVPACLLIGTHASNAFEAHDAQVGIAFHADETATAAALRVAPAADVRCGPGVTLGTVQTLGTLDAQSNITTLTATGGSATVRGSATVGTLDVDGPGAVVKYQSSGTVSTATIGPGTVDCSGDLSPRTFSSTTIRAGGRIIDPRSTITHTAWAIGGDVAEVTAT